MNPEFFEQVKRAILEQMEASGVDISDIDPDDINTPADFARLSELLAKKLIKSNTDNAHRISQTMMENLDTIEEGKMSPYDYANLNNELREVKSIVADSVNDIRRIDTTMQVMGIGNNSLTPYTKEALEAWQMTQLAISMLENKLAGKDDLPQYFA